MKGERIMLRLDPGIPLRTPKGDGIAYFISDCGDERNIEWTVCLDSSGEFWTFRNCDVRAQKNITRGREHISPFYDPDSVKIKRQELKETIQRWEKEDEEDKFNCGDDDCGLCKE
jgi:hypothetical protein